MYPSQKLKQAIVKTTTQLSLKMSKILTAEVCHSCSETKSIHFLVPGKHDSCESRGRGASQVTSDGGRVTSQEKVTRVSHESRLNNSGHR